MPYRVHQQPRYLNTGRTCLAWCFPVSVTIALADTQLSISETNTSAKAGQWQILNMCRCLIVWESFLHHLLSKPFYSMWANTKAANPNWVPDTVQSLGLPVLGHKMTSVSDHRAVVIPACLLMTQWASTETANDLLNRPALCIMSPYIFEEHYLGRWKLCSQARNWV